MTLNWHIRFGATTQGVFWTWQLITTSSLVAVAVALWLGTTPKCEWPLCWDILKTPNFRRSSRHCMWFFVLHCQISHCPAIFFFHCPRKTHARSKQKIQTARVFSHVFIHTLLVNRSLNRKCSPDKLSENPPTPPGTETDQRSSESENHSPPRLEFCKLRKEK